MSKLIGYTDRASGHHGDPVVRRRPAAVPGPADRRRHRQAAGRDRGRGKGGGRSLDARLSRPGRGASAPLPFDAAAGLTGPRGAKAHCPKQGADNPWGGHHAVETGERPHCRRRPQDRRGARAAPMSRSASSTSTASCAANTSPRQSSSRRSTAASASATWCWAGIPTTSSTTTSRSPAGTPPIPTRWCGSCRRPAAPCRSKATCCCFLGEFADRAEADLSARHAAPRARSAPRSMGYRRLRAPSSTSSSSSTRRPRACARRAIATSASMTPGFFGYSGLRSSVWAELYHEILDSLRDDAHPDRGPAHRDRPGRAGGRARRTTRRWRRPTAPRCSRPS